MKTASHTEHNPAGAINRKTVRYTGVVTGPENSIKYQLRSSYKESTVSSTFVIIAPAAKPSWKDLVWFQPSHPSEFYTGFAAVTTVMTLIYSTRVVIELKAGQENR